MYRPAQVGKKKTRVCLFRNIEERDAEEALAMGALWNEEVPFRFLHFVLTKNCARRKLCSQRNVPTKYEYSDLFGKKRQELPNK